MEKLELKGIDNVIFDLGMVIINLDMGATTKAFRHIYGANYDKVMNELNAKNHFESYETGKSSSEEFFNGLKEKAPSATKTKDLQNAWNAMLLNIPEERFEILLKMKSEKRTFCLSNTNVSHIEFIYKQLKKTKGLNTLDSFFEKVYLSQEMGMRKPDVEIFQQVIDDNQLDPRRTLFIDDTAGHLEGAKRLGLQTFHLDSGVTLEELF